MTDNVYKFRLNLDWSLLKIVSRLERFDATWSSIEKREGQSLKHLKNIATVRSVGASTRIEGSKMSDEEVKVLLDNLEITKIEERDAQEVVGYFDVLELILSIDEVLTPQMTESLTPLMTQADPPRI